MRKFLRVFQADGFALAEPEQLSKIGRVQVQQTARSLENLEDSDVGQEKKLLLNGLQGSHLQMNELGELIECILNCGFLCFAFDDQVLDGQLSDGGEHHSHDGGVQEVDVTQEGWLLLEQTTR